VKYHIGKSREIINNDKNEDPKDDEEEPFLNYQEIYQSPFQNELIMATPIKMRNTLSVEKKIAVLEKRIRETERRINQYQNEYEVFDISKKRRKQLEANIQRNMASLENLTNELNELTGANRQVGKMDIPPDSDDDDDMEGGSMIGLYRSGAKDTNSQIVKVANSLIYLLREATTMIRTVLFPIARILNPVQQDVLRRAKTEVIDALNTIPTLQEKTENSFVKASDQFIEEFNTIV
jgi:hypothetical protein